MLGAEFARAVFLSQKREKKSEKKENEKNSFACIFLLKKRKKAYQNIKFVAFNISIRDKTLKSDYFFFQIRRITVEIIYLSQQRFVCFSGRWT
jgi:hypothetical protein